MFMVLFLPPQVAVPVIVIHNTLINIIILFEARKYVNLKRIWPLMLFGVIGIPFGTYLLIVLDTGILKMLIGSFIILFSLAILKGYRKEIKNEKLAFAPVGFLSGFFKGCASIGGPPVVLFFSNQNISRKIFRANLVVYFLVLGLATIPIYFLGGLINQEVINYTLLLLPAMILGALTGIKLTHRIDEKIFKKIVLVILLFSGLVAIASGLGYL